MIITSAMPKVPSGWRRIKLRTRPEVERRLPGRSSRMMETAFGSGAAIVMTRSRVADTRVEPSVDQIDEGVGKNKHGDNQHDQRLGQGVILVRHSLHKQPADS